MARHAVVPSARLVVRTCLTRRPPSPPVADRGDDSMSARNWPLAVDLLAETWTLFPGFTLLSIQTLPPLAFLSLLLGRLT